MTFISDLLFFCMEIYSMYCLIYYSTCDSIHWYHGVLYYEYAIQFFYGDSSVGNCLPAVVCLYFDAITVLFDVICDDAMSGIPIVCSILMMILCWNYIIRCVLIYCLYDIVRVLLFDVLLWYDVLILFWYLFVYSNYVVIILLILCLLCLWCIHWKWCYMYSCILPCDVMWNSRQSLNIISILM